MKRTKLLKRKLDKIANETYLKLLDMGGDVSKEQIKEYIYELYQKTKRASLKAQ